MNHSSCLSYHREPCGNLIDTRVCIYTDLYWDSHQQDFLFLLGGVSSSSSSRADNRSAGESADDTTSCAAPCTTTLRHNVRHPAKAPPPEQGWWAPTAVKALPNPRNSGRGNTAHAAHAAPQVVTSARADAFDVHIVSHTPHGCFGHAIIDELFPTFWIDAEVNGRWDFPAEASIPFLLRLTKEEQNSLINKYTRVPLTGLDARGRNTAPGTADAGYVTSTFMRYWQPAVSHRVHLPTLSPPARLVRFARVVVGGRGGRSPWFGPARYALERPKGVREDAYTDDERSSALLHFFRRLTARGSWSPFIDDGDDKSGSNATGADYIGSASEELPPLRERAILVLDRDQKKRSIENVAELVSALRAAFEPLGVAVHRRTPTTIPDEHSPRGFTAGPRAMARLLAHNTSALISTHGSQLVNAGFLPPGAIVAEVCKK
jgi:hypothetical protein